MKDGYIQKVTPEPLLKDYICQYTFVDIPFEVAHSLEFKVMPSSHTHMVLFLGEPSFQELKNSIQQVDPFSLTGFNSKPHLFRPSNNLRQVMVHFTPWGMQPFLDFPIAEITDTRANLNHIFNPGIENLCECLQLRVSIQEKAAVLNRFFKKRLLKARQLDSRAKKLTQYILQINGSVRLPELAKNLFIGERTAQRLIHNAVGVNYKFFTKLVRLGYVRRLMSQGDSTLTDVAVQAGYFDQAHFIHDFQAMFGENPGEYLKQHQQSVWNRVDPY